MVSVDGKSIDVPAPTVPAGDYCADHLFPNFSYEQSGWTAQEETFNVLSTIRCAGVSAASERPETEHRVDVVMVAAPNCDSAPCQVRSLSAWVPAQHALMCATTGLGLVDGLQRHPYERAGED
jgi:hypothetical protein